MNAPETVVKMLADPPSVRIAGTVANPLGDPLERIVYLYDSARNLLEQKASDAGGNVEFVRPYANENNFWTARGGGYLGEDDDLSPFVRGTRV